MNSQYNRLLDEAKNKASVLAKDYIPRMYKELVEVEELDPHDAAERIKKDLVDTWARTTIYENLPDEAKEEAKQEAGKQSHKNVVETSATEVEQNGQGGSTATVLEQGGGGGSEDFDPDYDKLAKEYNQTLERLEGAQSHNVYLQDQIDQLKEAVDVLQRARPNLVQATSQQREESQPQRNRNRGYWIKFDLTNIELTRPLINIINRMRDRPKQFYIEIIGDDVVEVSETVLR